MTVDPVYNSDGDYVGSQIHSHPNDGHTDHSGRVKNWEQDYYQDSTGQVHHHFSDTVLEDERSSPTDFKMSDYEQALVDSIPNLVEAIDWAETADDFTKEELEAYNQALANQDLQGINAFYERLMPLYYEALQESQEAPEEVQQEEDMSDEEVYQTLEEEGVIDETLDQLFDDSYEITDEQVNQLDTVMSVFEEDTCEHQIANVGISVARGEITMEDAVTLITEQFGDAQAAKAYFKLTSILG